MNFDTQSGYLVVEKPDLKQRLLEEGLNNEFVSLYQAVLTSSMIDKELKPGMLSIIDSELKKAYIKEHVYLYMDSKERAEEVLGEFDTEVELFERYWELKPVYCMNIPIIFEYE